LGEAGKGLSNILRGFQSLHLDVYVPFLKPVVSFFKSFATTFGIPPDSDDTGCNLALGWQVGQLREKYPGAYQLWNQINSDSSGTILKLFLKYAYYPFSNEYPRNAIDPRTYVWIRGFLEEEQNQFRSSRSEAALITTWFQSTDEVPHQRTYQRMPFSVNNVDASVTVNALLGITALLAKQPELLTLQLRDFVSTNVRLVAWILRSGIVERYSSLVLLYYPPKLAFYWFAARLANQLHALGQRSKDDLFLDTASLLQTALEESTTPTILRSAQKESFYTFWDDFLGNADRVKQRNGTTKPLKIPEDRVFSTAMAVNALVDTWTTRNQTENSVLLVFRSNTPEKVVKKLSSAVFWLAERSWAYPKENGN
jgi:hypothetical protein